MANKVKKKSEGYKFKYSSLSDIADAGYEIPRLELEVINGVDYVCIKDEKGTHLLARVVEDSKATNTAMAYGSGLSYARRYATKMWNAIVDEDDKQIEGHTLENQKVQMISASQIEIISKGAKVISNDLKELGITKPSELKKLTMEQASNLCSKLKKLSS